MTTAKADPRLDVFVQKYEAMKGKRLSLAHPDNPFYPYLDRHFEDGLDAKDKAELHDLQEKGICVPRVYQLVIKGFLQLYPHLKPAFLDQKRGQKLKFMIGSGNRGPNIRCINHMFLSELRARRNLAEFAPIDMAAGIERQWGKEGTMRHRRPVTDWDILFSIQFTFGSIAFCNDYPPAITDILTTANKPGGMILTKDEELYLTERARFHGLLNGSEYRQAIEKISQGSPLNDRFRQIRLASGKFSFRKIEVVRGFWRPACQEIFELELGW